MIRYKVCSILLFDFQERMFFKISFEDFRAEGATMIFNLPNQINGNTVTLRRGYLSTEQKTIFEQWVS